MPGGTDGQPPMNIIYQTAEDGLADTVKPRLTALGADCSKVLVIDESERELTLSDRRLAQAIKETDAGLLLELLKDGEVASEELLKQSSALGISEQTLKIAKQNQGVVAVRRGDRWYTKLPDSG